MAKVNVTKRGKVWQYSFEGAKVNGKRKRISKSGFSTKKEALEAGAQALSEYNNTGLAFEPSKMSFSDYLDYWMENYCKLNTKYNTIAGYEQIIKNHIKPALGAYPIRAITPESLQRFINDKYINGYSKSYLDGFMNVLNSSLKYAVYPCGFIKDNPMQYVSKPKYKKDNKKKEFNIITQETFNRLIDRFPLGSNFYITLMIGFHTGLRIGEIYGLTWDDIDLKNKTLSVNKILLKMDSDWYFATPKTSSSYRTIRVGDTLLDALKKHRKWQLENKLFYGEFYSQQYVDNANKLLTFKNDNNIVIPYRAVDLINTKENGEILTSDSFKYAARIIHYSLGIEFRFHDLRHTHATMLIEAGANIKDVQARLGHSSLSTTMDTYAHVTKDMELETVNILENILRK